MTTIQSGVDYLAARSRWRARYRLPGGSWTTRNIFFTEGEARRWLDAELARAGVRAAGRGTPSALTLADFAETQFWPMDRVRASTRSSQVGLYRNYIVPRWGDRPLAGIGIDDVEDWLAELPYYPGIKVDRLAPATSRQIYMVFHKIVRRAVEKGHIERNPLPLKSYLKSTPTRKPARPLEPEIVESLAHECHGYYVMIYTLAYGGFRIGECVALRLDDLDFRHNEISVDEARSEVGGVVYGEPKRERSHRSVPMPQTVMNMIRDLVDKGGYQDERNFLFRSERGTPLSQNTWRERHFFPACHRIGLGQVDGRKYRGIKPHSLRHTAASTWFDEGFDLVEVARFLGDTVEVTEKTYIHLYRGRTYERMTNLDDRIARGRKAFNPPGPMAPSPDGAAAPRGLPPHVDAPSLPAPPPHAEDESLLARAEQWF
jgi:integrase